MNLLASCITLLAAFFFAASAVTSANSAPFLAWFFLTLSWSLVFVSLCYLFNWWKEVHS